MNDITARLAAMKAITNRARQEGCLLETQDNVFTPDDVDRRNQQGEFIWSHPDNWVMVTPARHLEWAQRQVDKAMEEKRKVAALVCRLDLELTEWQKGQEQNGTVSDS